MTTTPTPATTPGGSAPDREDAVAPAPRHERLPLALAGLATGGAGLAVSIAATAVLRERLTPPQAVAEAVIEVTPGRVAETLVHLLKHWDKPVLIAGVVVALALLSAWAGVLTRRGMWRGYAVFLVMAGAAGAAVLSRPGSTPVSVLPVVLGGMTWIVVLSFLLGAEPTAAPRDRRSFLIRTGGVALGAVVVGVGGRLIGHKRRVVEEARARLRLPVTKGRVPAGADVGVDGLEPWRVSASNFYRIDTAVAVPVVDVAQWKLRIHGMVDKELSLSFKDLEARQLTEAWVTLCCVSNPVGGDLIGNAWWSGVKISELLAEAGVSPDADAVLQTSEDGWTCGTPLAALTDDRNAMLAIAMNGSPLPLEHGFPVRMVVPGLYGYVSATKWVVDLEVTRFSEFDAFWTRRGWSEQGPVKTESRIDVPQSNHRVMAGDVTVAGVAWAQHTGISRVEVQLDGGAWTEVELGRVPDADTWVQWHGTVPATPGVHQLAVRATDSSGYTQTAVQRDVVPDGATGWHTVEFTAE